MRGGGKKGDKEMIEHEVEGDMGKMVPKGVEDVA